jgi:hypothetical protein
MSCEILSKEFLFRKFSKKYFDYSKKNYPLRLPILMDTVVSSLNICFTCSNTHANLILFLIVLRLARFYIFLVLLFELRFQFAGKGIQE